MTIEIRRLGPADMAAFDRVAADVFDHAIDRSRLAVYLATPGHFFIGAFSGGAGYGLGTLMPILLRMIGIKIT